VYAFRTLTSTSTIGRLHLHSNMLRQSQVYLAGWLGSGGRLAGACRLPSRQAEKASWLGMVRGGAAIGLWECAPVVGRSMAMRLASLEAAPTTPWGPREGKSRGPTWSGVAACRGAQKALLGQDMIS
jgi:hypothetical protein